MTNETAPPPHRKTVFLMAIGIAVAVVFGAVNYYGKVSGQTSTTNGPVIGGPGSAGINNGVINNGVPPPNAEAVRRNALLSELLNDYLSSHDGIQPTLDGRLAQAESYINDRLAAKGEAFRFDAKTRRFLPK